MPAGFAPAGRADAPAGVGAVGARQTGTAEQGSPYMTLRATPWRARIAATYAAAGTELPQPLTTTGWPAKRAQSSAATARAMPSRTTSAARPCVTDAALVSLEATSIHAHVGTTESTEQRSAT